MKNLDFALRVLAEVRQPIVFTVYGPKEDDQYWAECEALVRRLPPNIRFDYAGPLSHEKVYAELMKHDLFFLPTRGENYGHVLVEAWSAGLPVLTSDQTPWRGLAEKGIGWDLALSAIEDFVHVIEEVATLDDKTRAQCQVRCKSFIADRVGMEVEILNNRAMFLACLRLSS